MADTATARHSLVLKIT